MALHTLVLFTATALLFPALAADGEDDKPRRRVRLGGITIGAGYSHWSGSPFPFYPRWGYYPGVWAPGYWGL